jgi:RsiW-degrading membrane proteinase PrsW (M82 family)
VRLKALRDPEFDEPIDAMLYMIIVALGFATIENILVRPDEWLFHR